MTERCDFDHKPVCQSDMVHEAVRLFNEFSDSGWKLGSIASLANNFIIYNKSCSFLNWKSGTLNR